MPDGGEGPTQLFPYLTPEASRFLDDLPDGARHALTLHLHAICASPSVDHPDRELATLTDFPPGAIEDVGCSAGGIRYCITYSADDETIPTAACIYVYLIDEWELTLARRARRLLWG